MPTLTSSYKSQSEAGRLLKVPESTLRSWIKKFRPYVIWTIDSQTLKPIYDMDRLREIHYVCKVWGKHPVIRSHEEIGRELARRYPIEAATAGIESPPEPDFETLTAPTLAATGSDTLAAVTLLTEAASALTDATASLAAIANGPVVDSDVLALRADVGELRLFVTELKQSADQLARLTEAVPLLARQVQLAELLVAHGDRREGVQVAILAHLERQAEVDSWWHWYWFSPLFIWAALTDRLRGAHHEDDHQQPTMRPQLELVAPQEGP